MNLTVAKAVELLRRIHDCPDVMFTIDSNDSDLAMEIETVLEQEES